MLLPQWSIIFYLDNFAVYYTIYTSLNILGDKEVSNLQALAQALANFWGMITGANPNAVIVVLTGVIAFTTTVYAWVTWRLLRQSRWSFLVDALIRIAQRTEEREERYLNQLMGELSQMIVSFGDQFRVGGQQGVKMRWEQLRTEMETEPYREGLSKAIGGINKKLGVDLYKVLLDYMKNTQEARQEVKNKIESFRDELYRLEKEVLKQTGIRKV